MEYDGPHGPTTSEWILLHDYNLNPMDDTKYEEWEPIAAEEMHRFANLQTPMNIITLFDRPP